MTIVLAAQCYARRKFVHDAFERLTGRLPPGPVLVKPKVDPLEFYPGSTHPDVLDEVLNLLAGHDLTVADRWEGPHFRTRAPDPADPLAAVCARHGLELVNLHRLPASELRDSGETIRLPEAVISTPRR